MAVPVAPAARHRDWHWQLTRRFKFSKLFTASATVTASKPLPPPVDPKTCRGANSKAVLQRVKPVAACRASVVHVAQLCQHLWAFPWVREVAGAKVLFRTTSS